MHEYGLDAEAIGQAAAAIRQHSNRQPTVGIILGSGLGDLAARAEEPTSLPYSQIPFFVPSTVEGHRGDLVLGHMGGCSVAIMNGRLHYYEGYSLQQATFPIRVLREIGCSTLIITNAAGGLNPSFRVGDLMLISDHINFLGLAGHNPLFGGNDPNLGPRFPDMHNAYDRDLRRLALRVGRQLGLSLREGVYAMLGGPSFETPAEVGFLRAIGADAVGMSTASEVVVARHGGQRVLGISMISNLLSPTAESAVVSHVEVLEAGGLAVASLAPLIAGILESL